MIIKHQTSRRFVSSSNSNCPGHLQRHLVPVSVGGSLGGVWPGHGAPLRLAPRQGAEVAQLDQNLHLAIVDIRCLSIMLLTLNGYSIGICLSNYLFRVHRSEKDTFYLKEFCFFLTADLVSIGGQVDDAEIDNKF